MLDAQHKKGSLSRLRFLKKAQAKTRLKFPWLRGREQKFEAHAIAGRKTKVSPKQFEVYVRF